MKYLILILFLSSCSTAKELIDKAEKKDPKSVAEYAREKYPCKDLLKNDTAVIWRDSTIYIECPDTSANNPYEVVRFDTVNNVITKIVPVIKTIRVPVNVPIRTQVITKWYEDSAKMKIYATDLSGCNTANENLQASNDSLSTKAAHRGKENWIWRIIASFFILLFIWRKYRQLTSIIHI